MNIEALINLKQYPLNDLTTTTAQKLIARCQAELQTTGKCSLSDFLRPEVVPTLAAEVKSALKESYVQLIEHNVYFKKDDASLPDDHPARQRITTRQKALAYDRIPVDAGIRAIYNWQPLRDFIAQVVGHKTLYLHEDPMAPLNIMMLAEGDQLGWHYDRADFVTTLLLQAPEVGGRFEYVPHLRTADNENYAGLSQLLDDTHPDKISLAGQAGTLTLFQGIYSPHRVTQVQGATPRINSILSYTLEPGVVFSESARMQFYGRAK
ncbi:MAG: 2OG-Fe(II) oxygenase [Chloroflexota bacterium]